MTDTRTLTPAEQAAALLAHLDAALAEHPYNLHTAAKAAANCLGSMNELSNNEMQAFTNLLDAVNAYKPLAPAILRILHARITADKAALLSDPLPVTTSAAKLHDHNRAVSRIAADYTALLEGGHAH